MIYRIFEVLDRKAKLILSSFFLLSLLFFSGDLRAQVIDSSYVKLKKDSLQEIQSQLKTLKDQESKIKAEIKTIEKSIKSYPIWKKGIFGTVGFNISRFNDWLSKNQSNTSANTIAYAVNLFMNLEEEKYYWNNRVNLVQSWLQFDDKTIDDDDPDYQVASDNFNFNSLLAYKFSNTLAASASFEYRTGILETRFNNPGNLDIGVGASWNPKENFVFTLHPLNYNVVYSDISTLSSIGLKAQANYNIKFANGLSWASNFSGFRSYKDKALNNWIMTNSFSKSIKNLGIGFDLSFKQSKQEAIARGLIESPLQWYYVIGLSYNY